MSIVANEGKNVLVNYNYMLRVEGIYDLPCKAVHSFTKENEFEYVQEGGLNDYVHMLRKPITKPFTFTVERYVGTDPIPPLPLGAELVLPVILMVSPFPDRFDISKRTFVFTGCTVMSKTFGELNAEKSGILTETIVIGYREMVEVTIPVHIGEDGSIWAFDEKKVEGKGKRSARTYERPEEDRVAKKRQWLVENNGVIKYVGDQSATDRSKFYEAVSEEDLLEKRYWRLSGPELIDQSVGDKQAGAKTENRVFKKSARTEPDTDAIVRRWNIAGDTKKMTIDGQTVEVPQLGGGEASARTEPDTDAVKRQWLAEEEGIYKNKGKQSARTREDFYKADTEVAEGTEAAADELPRQWLAEEEGIYKNKGKQSARTREDFYKVDTDAAEGTDAAVNKLPRQWLAEEEGIYKNKGNQSARTREDFYKVETETEEGSVEETRRWEFGETAKDFKGTGNKSRKDGPDTDPKTRRWEFGETAKDYEGSGDKSRKTEADTEVKVRRWEFGETAKDYEGAGDKSRKTEKNTDVKSRKWEMDRNNPEGKGQRSATTEKKEEPKTRKWQMVDKNKVAGDGTRSAVTEKSSKASGRKWPAVSSAKKQSMKDTEGRSWDKPGDNKLGGGTASAAQSPNSKAERRIWPEQSSARKRQE